SRHARRLCPWMVLALGVPFELHAVEVDIAQAAGAITFGLVGEVASTGLAALSSRSDGFRADSITELDHRHETVSAGAIPFLRIRVGLRPERCQRSPDRGREAHGRARLRVVEARNDLIIEPLEAIDITPRRFPRTKIRRQAIRGRSQALQQLLRRN